jgi:hypothetical protein
MEFQSNGKQKNLKFHLSCLFGKYNKNIFGEFEKFKTWL